MAHIGTPVRVVLAGWGLIFLFAVLLMLFGAGELVFGALHGLVAVIMATWVWRRGSRLALIVSLALGLLLGIRQAAYIAGDITGRHIDAGTLFEDVIGLAGGLLLVAGAAAALLRRSRNRRVSRPARRAKPNSCKRGAHSREPGLPGQGM